MSELFGKQQFNVGVVGATGLVGEHMLDILTERDFPIGHLELFASERSEGKEILFNDKAVVVQPTKAADFSGLDIVFMSAGATLSREIAPIAAKAGAIVIDNSSAWRTSPGVPLVVSEVNPEKVHDRPLGIIANPNCTTMIAMSVLKPLHEAAFLQGIVTTTFQAASGIGQRGVDELLLGQPPDVFPEPIERNVIPRRGNVVGRDTDEELKLLDESRKILDHPNLKVSATCVSVPVVNGHSLAVEAKFDLAINPKRAEQILSESPGVALEELPTPQKVTGRNVSLVGRIRQSRLIGKAGLSFFITGDNLRKGAALNAVQIAELLIQDK